MIRSYRKIENSYIKNFSRSEDKENHIVFRDDKLPDMYSFNCILIKENMSRSLIEGFITNSLNQSKRNGEEFLKIIFHPLIEITDGLKGFLSERGFDIQTNLYMKIDGNRHGEFKINREALVKAANTEDEYEAVRAIDTESSISVGIPSEFVLRKTLRKKEVFKDIHSKLYPYLCYCDNHAVGMCELYIKDGYAKIEEFTVLDAYQRRGFGTTLLKNVISDTVEKGIENIYLITDKDDTPKEMYKKLGFVILGEELEALWKRPKTL